MFGIEPVWWRMSRIQQLPVPAPDQRVHGLRVRAGLPDAEARMFPARNLFGRHRKDNRILLSGAKMIIMLYVA